MAKRNVLLSAPKYARPVSGAVAWLTSKSFDRSKGREEDKKKVEANVKNELADTKTLVSPCRVTVSEIYAQVVGFIMQGCKFVSSGHLISKMK